MANAYSCAIKVAKRFVDLLKKVINTVFMSKMAGEGLSVAVSVAGTTMLFPLTH